MQNEKLKIDETDVERLHSEHEQLVLEFSCRRRGEDLFLQCDALANQNFRLSETLLLFEKGRRKIVSYITLSVGSFRLSPNRKISGMKIRNKPYRVYSNNMPCLFIGKLATDKEEEGRGGASMLVSVAIRKALELNAIIPVPFVSLDAYTEAVPYYEKLGFRIAFDPKQKDPKTIAMYLRLFE